MRYDFASMSCFSFTFWFENVWNIAGHGAGLGSQLGLDLFYR